MRRLIMTSLPLTLLAMALVTLTSHAAGPNSAMSTAMAPPSGPTEVVYELTFNGPDDTFTFTVEKAQKAGDLTVETLDCCLEGDMWRADLNPVDPEDKDTYGVGDGNIDTWSGTAEVHPWIRGTVTVSYEEGVDTWPATMWVKFSYSTASEGNTGMNITPEF